MSLTAAVCTVRIVRDLGLVRLPSARPRVSGIRYAGVGIRLVAGVVTSGVETASPGITAVALRAAGVWRGLLNCWDSGRKAKETVRHLRFRQFPSQSLLELGSY
jgi:hypothetical protein